MQRKGSKIVFLSFGLGGHIAYARPLKTSTCRISGYESPESFLRRLSEFESEKYGSDTYPDGIPVRDGRAAFEANPGLAYREPLIDVRLSGPSVNPCPTSEFGDIISAGFGAVGAAYRAESRNADAPRKTLADIGGFDSVSIETYLDWWREFGKPFGARIGKLRRPKGGDAFYEWED